MATPSGNKFARNDVERYRNSIVEFHATCINERQILYYDPTNCLYWDPVKNEFYAAHEVLKLMNQRLTKITIRFDYRFPK